MKKKVLIIFKYLHEWNVDVTETFSKYYDTDFLYISDFKNKNFTEIINAINNLIKSKGIEIVVFDAGYLKFINLFFIKKINSKKKILMTADNFHLYELNSITANACDIILCADPFSTLKFKEKGYEAFTFFQIHHQIESMSSKTNKISEHKKINKNNNKKKEIDVLFFGYLTPDRKNILDYIAKEGIHLKNVGYEENVSALPQNELWELIKKSKIVINLSKSRSSVVQNYASENVFKFAYQFKGRIFLAGFHGVACVSEYSPGQELLFNEDELPTFFTKGECVKILKKLLKNNELLAKYATNLNSKTTDLCDDKKNFEPIYNAMQKSNHRKVELIKVPYWYLRIAAKQILLRNIKLSTLIKTIFQFNVIFTIIKNSNFLIKFLIVFESILNILWYSLILTFRPKK